jgi:hypothetical protein
MMNWYSVRVTFGLLISLGAAACGSGKFSDDFAEEIQKDCVESQSCVSRTNITECITKTGSTTDKWTTAKQQEYVDTVVRCEIKNGCDYVNCTASDPLSGYAGAHQPQIAYECQQRVGCKIASGQASAPNEVQTCIDTTSAMLNANPTAQATFDVRSVRCATAMGCAYNTCM